MEIMSNTKVVKAKSSAAISSNTTTAGDIIDMSGYSHGMFIMLSTTLTDGAYAPKIEIGDDSGLSDAVELTGSNLLGTTALGSFAATDDNAVKRIGFKKLGKRYARLSIVSTGVTSGGTIGAVCVLGGPELAPVTQ